MNSERLLLVLRARHALIWGSILFFAAAAIGYSLIATKQYTATTRLLLDAREPDLLLNQVGSYSVLAPTYIATQVDILHSDRVAYQVIHSLGLDSSAQAIGQWEKNREGSATLEQYYAEVLGKILIVVPSRTSNTLSLEFSSPNPQFAAETANAYARAYLDVSAELKADPAKNYNDWFAARTKEERAQLEAAQEKLSAFQRENGIVGTDERLDVETTRLNELNTQLTLLQGQLAESASREKQAQGLGIGTSPDVLHNNVVESLRTDIARNEGKLEDMAKQYGSNHPAYLRARAELMSLKAALQQEMEKVASTVGASNDVNVRRESDMRSAMRAQKNKVLQLRAQHDQMEVLQRDVDAAQKSYDLVALRLSQTGIESQVKSTNIVVLEEARIPTKPSSPHVLRNTVIGLGVGFALGIGLALAFERRRPRIRNASDIAEYLALPFLASIPRARSLKSARSAFSTVPA